MVDVVAATDGAGREYAWATDVGRVREKNEDNLLVLAEHSLWAVIDGMGGYHGGRVASQVAVDTLAGQIRNGDSLSGALRLAHHEIKRAAAAGQGGESMGATAVAACLDGDQIEIAWVGDSRAYLWDGQSLRQLTRDHSFVQRLIDAGAISAAEAEAHPDKNVVTQALGTPSLADVQVDSCHEKLCRGEMLLLCSDGLSGEVTDADMARILRGTQTDIAGALSALIQAALDNGGNDNVTAILVAAPKNAPPRSRVAATVPIDAARIDALAQAHQAGARRAYIRASLIAVFLALPVIGYFFLHDPHDSRALAPAGVAAQPSPVDEPPVADYHQQSPPPRSETDAESEADAWYQRHEQIPEADFHDSVPLAEDDIESGGVSVATGQAETGAESGLSAGHRAPDQGEAGDDAAPLDIAREQGDAEMERGPDAVAGPGSGVLPEGDHVETPVTVDGTADREASPMANDDARDMMESGDSPTALDREAESPGEATDKEEQPIEPEPEGARETDQD